MRVARLVAGSVGLAVVSVALLATPAAAASPYINISPQTAGPGETIRIVASCGKGQTSGTASSDAFGSVTLTQQGLALAGTTQLAGGTPPGLHQVTLACARVPVAKTTLTVSGGQSGTGASTIAPGQPADAPAAGAPAASPSQPTAAPAGEPTVAPATGVGSMAARGLGTLIGGAVVLLGALVLGVVAVLRRDRAARP